MNVTFKNVGQGDSIIFEWVENSKDKIGILDSNIFNDRNPVLEHISKKSFDEIDFIIISHPHYDHYSGIREILEYCEQNDIKIKRLLHSAFKSPNILKAAVKGVIPKQELKKLFIKIKKMYGSKAIIKQSYVTDEIRPLMITNDIKLVFLAPSVREHDNYESKTFSKALEEKSAEPHGNWLSSVIKIEGKDWMVILTSDVEKIVLKRITDEIPEELTKDIILAQIPHHGSRRNHRQSFWAHLKKREPKAVVSVGENQYGHPKKYVLKKFRDLSYDVYATNEVGDLKNTASNEEDKELDALLMNVGIKDFEGKITSRYNGDKSFDLSSGIAKLL